jgi:hypothetical protein
MKILKTKKVKKIIDLLKKLEVDGETMEYILEKVGMTDQMLRQLIMNNPETDTKDLLAEKIELSDQHLRFVEEKARIK